MVAAPSPRTWVDLEIPPVDTWNQELYETWQFLLNPPMVKARQSSAQSTTNGAWTAITFDWEEVDTHGFHSNSTNPSRFKPTVPGRYVGYFGTSWVSNSTGFRKVGLRLNGTDIKWRSDSQVPLAGNSLILKGNSFGPLYLNGTTDYVEVVSYQNSGASLSTLGAGGTDWELQPEFYMRWWSA